MAKVLVFFSAFLLFILGAILPNRGSSIEKENASLLLAIPAEPNCTCVCIECPTNDDGCWEYDYSKSGNEGYVGCDVENDCKDGDLEGWIEQHVKDVNPSACTDPPPVLSF